MPEANGNGHGQPGELVDLDAWLEEEAAKAPRIKLFGETFALPADIPFDVQLAAWRLAQDKGDDHELEPEEVVDMIARYVTAERVVRWRTEHQVGDRTLSRVLKVIVGHYQEPDAPGGDGQGEPVAPTNRAGRRAAAKASKGGSRASSRTGSSSRRTSSGSTGSTSRRSGDG